MYCRCGKNFSLEDARLEPAPSDWQAQQVWVCNKCDKISHAAPEERHMTRGPSPNQQLTHALSKQNGQHILTWAVGKERIDTVEFFPWPRRFPMTETEPLIFRTWELLMSKVKIIMSPVQNDLDRDNHEIAKHQARGIAEVLAIQMKPFMESANDVVRHAVEAHKDSDYQVPGLGKHLWDPMHNPDGSLRVRLKEPKRTAAAKPIGKVQTRTGNRIPDSAIDGVKGAIGAGMFTVSQVGATYSMSEAEVKEQLGID